VHVSIECALTGSPLAQPLMLLHEANEAMYGAKRLPGTHADMGATDLLA